MPVPAFRNSRSRVRRRRSHLALKPVRVTIDKDSGEAILPHHEAPKAKAVATAVKKPVKAKKAPAKAAKPAKAHDHDHDHAGHTH